MKCADCFYYRDGRCKRYPPDRGPSGSAKSVPVEPNDWCGEHSGWAIDLTSQPAGSKRKAKR